MNNDSFWKLINTSRKTAEGDPEHQIKELEVLLEQLPEAEIIEFHEIFNSYFYSSYTWRMWGAAYVIGGGCSDDGFDYFRGWLISRGEEVFTAAMADPDNLALTIKEEDQEIDCQVEGWQSVSITAWIKKTGLEYSDFPFKPSRFQSDRPAGDEWEEEDLDRLYPKLSQRFN